MDLAIELKALCTILLMEDDKTQICEEISEQLVSEKDKDTFVFWLLKTWTFSNVKDYRCFGLLMDKKLNVADICKIVRELGLEERFARTLLLLPELKKKPLLKSLCHEISANLEENTHLSSHLFKISLSEYPRNIMVSCSYNFDARTLELFSENMNIILRCMSELKEAIHIFSTSLMHCLDSLLIDTSKSDNNLLDLDRYSQGRYTLSDILQVQQYCKQLKQDSTSSHQNLGSWQLWKQLISSPHWIQMICRVIGIFKMSLKENQVENLQEAFLVSLAMKLKLLLSSLEEDRKELQEDTSECLRLMKELLVDSDLLSFICDEATMDEINDMKKTSHDNNLCREVWDNLDNTSAQKITLGLNIITNLYHGHHDVFKWMVHCRNLPDQFHEAWIQVAISYIVNYGTVADVASVIYCILDRDNCNFKNYIENLEMIAHQTLPSLSIQQVNELLHLCRGYYQQHQTILCNNSKNPYIREDFQKELNEIFNKMTESSVDISDDVEMDRLQKLAILCLKSPLYVLDELLTRVFDGHLKSTIAAKVLHFLPVLSSITFLGELNESLTLFSLTKRKFLSQRDKLASEENLADLLLCMSKCGDKANQENITTTIIDEIIYPNLCDLENGDVHFTTTIRILKELQFGDCISMSQAILLLEVLFCYLRPSIEDEIPMIVLQCFEELNNIVHRFVDIVQLYYDKAEQMNEKNGIVNFVKQLLEDHDWSTSFYFHPFFNCISQNHTETLKIPACFVDKFGVKGQQCEAIVDTNYQDEYGYWLVLFELYIINEKLTESYMEHFPTINIDEEFDYVIAAINQQFKLGGVNKFKAFKIYDCLMKLTRKGKLSGVDSFAPEKLSTDCHGYCLCVALTLEVFKLMFSTVDVDEMTEKELFDLHNFPKVLDFFNKYMKDMDNFSNLCYFGLFFLDATLETISSFQKASISQNFLLLMLDTLVIIDKSCRTLPQDVQNSMLNECKRIVESYSKDSTLMTLREKAEEMAAKL